MSGSVFWFVWDVPTFNQSLSGFQPPPCRVKTI